MSTLYSVGLMNQLADAFEKAGFTSNDVTRLRSRDRVVQVLDVLRGLAKVVPIIIIDCDANPYLPKGSRSGEYILIPEGLKVEEHTKAGEFAFTHGSFELYLSAQQKTSRGIEGNLLHPQLSDLPVLNANVLDHLLRHTQFIPENWKGKTVFFWGTIYRASDNQLFVRGLKHTGRQWIWTVRSIDDSFNASEPAIYSSE